MKKTALMTLLAGFICMGNVQAQDMLDAYKLSKSDYEGTARTVAMGNAFTALGGDLGAVNINPASLAVTRYNQWTITPGVNISINSAMGTLPPEPNNSENFTYFQRDTRNRWTKFDIPNIGASLHFDTHHQSGLKSWTIGVAYNRTWNYLDNMVARGTNKQTSLMGAMAADITNAGIPFDDLMQEDSWNRHTWKRVIAAQSGMISAINLGGNSAIIGNNETFIDNGDGTFDIFQAGEMGQDYKRIITGGKYDCVINLGFNISDEFYLGANLGITTLDYNFDDCLTESSVDPKLFEQEFTDKDGNSFKAQFDYMKYKYSYSATGTGIYGKFGFIWAPKFMGLRVGAAIQTPTLMNINEKWQNFAENRYIPSNVGAEAQSPLGEFSYKLRTPLTANFGVAYTLGRLGVISVDYELTDYNMMRLKDSKRNFDDVYEPVNQEIKDLMVIGHKFRAGLEIKPLPSLALRAGYGLMTSGERFYNAEGIKVKPKHSIDQNFAFGIGYSTRGTFFFDLAAQCLKYGKEYVYLYDDYLLAGAGIYSPEIESNHTRWNVLCTLGFRF